MKTKNGSLILMKKQHNVYSQYSIVLCLWREGDENNLPEYVVWDMLSSTKECECGFYSLNLEESVNAFNTRIGEK